MVPRHNMDQEFMLLCKVQKHVGHLSPEIHIGPDGTFVLSFSLLQITIFLYWGPHKLFPQHCLHTGCFSSGLKY